MSLNNKVAIVTGGERGIGKAIVKKLLGLGMKVCIAGIDTASADETLKELDAGDDIFFLETDVREEEAVRSMCQQVIERFGGIDAMVANAAIAEPPSLPVEEIELEEWDDVIRTNLTGCFLSAKYSFGQLRKRGGSMVLISSIRALQSMVDTVHYGASKGGVISLTHALAYSGSPKVRVNCISPGWIINTDHDQFPEKYHREQQVGRVGKPEDVAGMVAYLLSDEASFITGQNFVIDGGITTKMYYCHWDEQGEDLMSIDPD